MGIGWFRLDFTGDEGCFVYSNAQGEKTLRFGLQKNVFGKFPQLGYSDDRGNVHELTDFRYDCAASAGWLDGRTLQLRVQIIDRVLRGQVHLYLLNFLKILCERGALNEYEGCLAAFKTLYNQAHGIVEATVTTAVPLDDEQRVRMSEKLSAKTGKTVVLTERVDESLMGGVLLEMNGQRYDNTLKNRLKSIHSAMVQGA